MNPLEVNLSKKTKEDEKTCDPFPWLLRHKLQPCIPGFNSNVICFVHSTVGDNKDCKAGDKIIQKFESRMVTQICQYLFWNGFKPNEVQILSNCVKILDCTKKKLNKRGSESLGLIPTRHTDQQLELDGNKITVVILSVTHDIDEELLGRSISRGIFESREGVIIICHFDLIIHARIKLWADLIEEMYKRSIILPFIELRCEAHKKIIKGITTPEELRLSSPKGGCQDLCTERPCGHICFDVCHPLHRDHAIKDFWCKLPCILLCEKGHLCRKLCYQKCECQFDCQFKKPCGHDFDNHKLCITRCNKELPCGHICKNLCHQCFIRGHDGRACDVLCDRRCSRDLHPCPVKHSCSSRCPPCNEIITYRLPCDHKIIQKCCDEVPNIETYRCESICNRHFNFCEHACRKKCYEECGQCEEVTLRPHPKCGHKTPAKCHTPITSLCAMWVTPTKESRCGHPVKVPCHSVDRYTPDKLSQFCLQPCDTIFNLSEGDCGHYCYGMCFECFQGRFHLRCKLPCGKLLICGHECRIPCPLVCPPCTDKCMMFCDHYFCPYECGVPCDYICEEPCPYQCPHLKCTKLCGEVCNREGCTEPCPFVLKCDHPCVGFCGEDCPPLCRICNTKELLEGMFTDDIIKPEHRFIYLTNCGHTFEADDLNSWLTQTDDNGEIRLKRCPLCSKPISLAGLKRYSALLISSFKEVNEVKKVIYGNEEDIKTRVNNIREKIVMIMATDFSTLRLKQFAQAMLDVCDSPMKTEPIFRTEAWNKGIGFCSLYQDKVAFLNVVCEMWIMAEKRLEQSAQLWQPAHLASYERLYTDFFDMIKSRHWPLHPNEWSSIFRELYRLDDAYELYRCMSLERDDHILKLANTREGRQKFAEAEDLVLTWDNYGKRLQSRFKIAFAQFLAVQNYTLEISEAERQDIIKAFGGRAGRWFKCPYGHVYVVTECGGATEVGQCNECGAIIGGQNHALLDTNQLASEMDGAESPLYPTALNRRN